MQNEIWKDINYRYQVSNLGRVRNKPRITKSTGLEYGGGIMALAIGMFGYYQLSLRLIPGKGETRLVHRLVAEAFIPNPENRPTVNHINGNKLDNRVENLEWATRSENIQHAFDTGLNVGMKGEIHPQSKLTEATIQDIRFQYINSLDSCAKIGKKYGVCGGAIQQIVNLKSWSHVPLGTSLSDWKRLKDNRRTRIKSKIAKESNRFKTAKLSQTIADEIRAKIGIKTGRELAKEYGVHPSIISAIKLNQIYKKLI